MTTSMTTPTPRTTTPIRCLLAMALVAFLLLTAAPARRAEASQSGSDVNTAALQMAICRWSGGTATVNSTRTVGSGLIATQVFCNGGWGGGWYCLTVYDPDTSICSWNLFQPPTGGQADHTTTGGVLAEEPVDDAPTGAGGPVAPVLEEPVVVDAPVDDPVMVDEPVVVVEEPSIPTPEPTPPTDEEPDGGPVDEPAGHDLGDEVAPDEPVMDAPVDDPVVDPVVVDPLVDPALADAEVAAEPAVDGESFDGE